MPPASVRAVLSAVTELVAERLAAGEPTRVQGLGTFAPRWHRERVLRRVSDGRRMAVDGSWRATFQPANPVRNRLRALTPQYHRDPEHQQAWRLAEALIGDLALYQASQVPLDLPEDAAGLEATCAAAFGGSWERARQRYLTETPDAVRATRDHLADAARRRFGADED